MTKAPHVPPELLKYLDEMFPDRCPDPAWPDREIWLRAGERRLVRHLQRLANQQQERPADHVFRSLNAKTGQDPTSR